MKKKRRSPPQRYTGGRTIPAPPTDTLSEARREVMSNLEEGTHCRCCGKFCKLYKRKINSGMALFIVELCLRYNDVEDWIDVRKIWDDNPRMQRGDHAYLQHWGLVEAMPNDDPSKRTSGFWRPTEDGMAFAMNESSVPARVHLYNREVVGWSREQTNIVEALGENFDYEELMEGL